MAWSDVEFLAEVQRTIRISPRPLPQGRSPRAVSAVADPCRRAPARGAASSSAMPRRGCTRSPAWASTWGCAMSRAWPSSLPSDAASPRSMPGCSGLLAEYDAWRAADRGGRHCIHRWTGADVCQSAERGAAAAQCRTPGLRPVAAREGGAVPLEHRRRRRRACRNWRAASPCNEYPSRATST